MSGCPFCGGKTKTELSNWKYAAFDVRNCRCTNCTKTYKVYYNNGKLSHIIPNANQSIEHTIISYLRKHENATLDEISEAAHIPVEVLLNALRQLENSGKIESVQRQ